MDGYGQSQNTLTTQEKPKRGGVIAISILFVLVAMLGAGGGWLYMNQQSQISQISKLDSDLKNLTTQLTERTNVYYTSSKNVGMYVLFPTANAKANSPQGVVGMVPGGWSQENSFTVQVKNSQGTVVASAPATLHGTWTTDNLQLFTASIAIPSGQSGSGTLVINNANPSGLADKADSVSIPLQF